MLQYSTSVRNAKLDAIQTAIGPSAVLKIRSGAAPTSVLKADRGTVLATVLLPFDWMHAAANGEKWKSGTWKDTSADASGTPGHFRVYASDATTPHIQGTVGTVGTDMILDSSSFTVGQEFTVITFTIADNNA